jgi:hypothetical protein
MLHYTITCKNMSERPFPKYVMFKKSSQKSKYLYNFQSIKFSV